MLWPRDQFRVAYEQIKGDATEGGCTVLVLISPDVDSVCATKVLAGLFKADLIAYSILPVLGHHQFPRINAKHVKKNEDLRSLILINCGGMINLSKAFSLQEYMKVYVIDSHRPLHLSNVYDNGQIVIFDDEAVGPEELPSDASDIENDGFEDDESDEENERPDSDSESEPELEKTEVGTPSGKKRKRSEDEDDQDGEAELDLTDAVTKESDALDAVDDEEDTEIVSHGVDTVDDDDDDDNEHEQETTMKSPRANDREDESKEEDELSTVEKEREARKAKRSRRRRLLQYYRGSFYGAPASVLLYELASQMNINQNDSLWLAIIGLTKQFMSQQVDTDNYEMMVQKFQNEVFLLNKEDSQPSTTRDGVIIPAVDNGKISFEEEYRFMLYRHWNLYESMLNSDYIIAALSTWRADGKDDLQLLLAKMGVSLKQSKQRYTYMSVDLRAQLQKKIRDLAPDFGLNDILYGSFRRQFAYKSELCAADVVYAIDALLDSPQTILEEVLKERGLGQGIVIESEGDDELLREKIGKLTSGFERHWIDNFYAAYTALMLTNDNSSKLFDVGVQMAKRMQQEIVRLAGSVIERKLISRTKHFRYAILRLNEAEEEMLTQPKILFKLGLLLLDIYRIAGKWVGKNALPLVLLVRNELRNSFVVLGLACPQQAGDVVKNSLGTAFRMAAEDTDIKFVNDGFESYVLEILSDDVQLFVEQLHNVMDA